MLPLDRVRLVDRSPPKETGTVVVHDLAAFVVVEPVKFVGKGRRLCQSFSVGPVRSEEDPVDLDQSASLTPEQREAAPILYRALPCASEAANDGERSPDALMRQFTRTVGDAATVQYFTAVEADTMARLDALHGRVRLLASIELGSVRLVDYLGLELGS